MGQKYTVNWNQWITSSDLWLVGEERELTTEQFYWMETTYPGALRKVQPERADPRVPPPADPELRAETPDQKRMVAKAPARGVPKPSAKPSSTKKAG